ncbi:MAG TPA: hypothetical protein VG028_06915 [Terriglobia bacterium]|nr:hypothetical protein [Terriglobia bacterium]
MITIEHNGIAAPQYRKPFEDAVKEGIGVGTGEAKWDFNVSISEPARGVGEYSVRVERSDGKRGELSVLLGEDDQSQVRAAICKMVAGWQG